jgi:hypothetical protein
MSIPTQRYIGLLFAAVLLIPAGCTKKDERPRPRLVSEEELAGMDLEIKEIAERNRAKKCPRPVLRGEPLPGPAAADIVAVVEGADDTRDCLKRLDETSEMVFEALDHPEDFAPEGFPARLNRTSKPQSQAPKELLELEKTCTPLLARIQRAVSHSDACSPYLPGLHDQPGYVPVIRASRLAAAKARRLFAEDDAGPGFDLLLDVVRFGQDFGRGGTSLLETMIGVACARTVLPMLEHGLNRKKPLDPALLARIEEELGQLIATQAHPVEFLRGEMEAMATYTFNPSKKSPETLTIGTDERDDNALALLALRETSQDVLSGCKQDDPPIRCEEHIRAVAERYRKSHTGDLEKAEAMLRVAVSPDKAAAVRREIIDILKSVAAPGYDRYLRHEGQTRFQLAALRLHAAYRRLAEQAKTCPKITAFDQPPLSGLRADPYSQKPMRIEELGPGRFALWCPVPLGKPNREKAEPAVFIDCPYR